MRDPFFSAKSARSVFNPQRRSVGLLQDPENQIPNSPPVCPEEHHQKITVESVQKICRKCTPSRDFFSPFISQLSSKQNRSGSGSPRLRRKWAWPHECWIVPPLSPRFGEAEGDGEHGASGGMQGRRCHPRSEAEGPGRREAGARGAGAGTTEPQPSPGSPCPARPHLCSATPTRGPGWTPSDTAVTTPCHLILPPPDLYKEMSLPLPSFYCKIHHCPSLR